MMTHLAAQSLKMGLNVINGLSLHLLRLEVGDVVHFLVEHENVRQINIIHRALANLTA